MSNETALQEKTQEQVILDWLVDWAEGEGGLGAHVACMVNPVIFHLSMQHPNAEIRHAAEDTLKKLSEYLTSFEGASQLGMELGRDDAGDIAALTALVDSSEESPQLAAADVVDYFRHLTDREKLIAVAFNQILCRFAVEDELYAAVRIDESRIPETCEMAFLLGLLKMTELEHK